MPFEDPELVAAFVVESKEHLGDVENQLLAIEAGGADVDVELVNTVFRAVHSIKGAAGFLGLNVIKELSHSLESVLNLMREEQITPTSATINVLLRSADELSNLLDDVEGSNGVSVEQLVDELERIVRGEISDSASEPAAEAAPSTPVESQPATPEPVEPPASPAPPVEEASKEVAPPKPNPSGNATPQGGNPPKKAAQAATETNIRVSVDVLDQLMNLAGELVLGRNQLLQLVASTENSGLEGISTHINQVTSELQDAIMQTRMQPIGSVFTRFSRIVRDLSGQLGKQCSLELEGQDVEVDKTIIEAIGDPLTHLVRNSVDHGIESPSDREAAGKPATGKLRLVARHKSGKVSIEIIDDGAGISADKLKAKALDKGLITPEHAQQMSDREAVRLIFHPGFSTAQAVTDVSGRGVGMDVVRRNIERLGGDVEVDTKVGVGTTISVTLPLTLAIIPSLIVRCGEDRFAIPQVNIRELVRLRPTEIGSRIGRVKDAEVLRLRGKLLPLVRLSDCLEVDSDRVESEGQQARNIIVVETGATEYGLIVDGLFDSEEIVVKPLGRHLKSSPCLAGATILGDGRVALILDIAGISSKSELRALKHDDDLTSQEDEEESALSSEEQPVLLFTNHPSEQFAVPMTLIERIERIRYDQIDSVGGNELLQYRGTSLPLLSLERLVQAAPREEQGHLYVIVFEAAGREVGIIAANLIDIRSVSADFDTMTFDEEGICGSQVIDERTTRAVDLMGIARKARPDWFEKTDRLRAADPSSPVAGSPVTAAVPTILLAEDSSFFRRQVKGFLESEGYRVVDCEDGQVAWHTLAAGHADIDLVLTDIEMPNMNGLELSRRIKDDENYQHLPIIALTSLAGQEDRQRGIQAGIDDYQVKLDRERLLEAVATYAPLGVVVA